MVDPRDIALAHALADAAGAVIRPHFRTSMAIDSKSDASPVTVADRAAEAAMRQLIFAQRPGDGVIGEEYGEDRRDAERVWVLDPIDGTRAFIAGRPLFGTLIALLVEDVPVLGIIDQCIIGDRWVGAHGHGATLGASRVRTRTGVNLADAHLGTTAPGYFSAQELPRFDRLRAAARDTLWGGDCHNYGLVASGHLDLVVESQLKLHDWAALMPIIQEAGGTMTDWQGHPLTVASEGQVIAAGSKALAAEAVACLKP